MTYAEAAQQVGLTQSWVARVAARENWQALRQKHLLESRGYQDKIRTLKAQLLARAVEAAEKALQVQGAEADVAALDAVKAWNLIERAYPEHRYGEAGSTDQEARKRGRLETLELICRWAAEHEPNLLAALEPHLIDLGGVIEDVNAA